MRLSRLVHHIFKRFLPDEVIHKVWSLSSGAPVLEHTFECEQGAVLSVVISRDTIYAGCQDGYVKVWDLETKTLVRRIIISEVSFKFRLLCVKIVLYSFTERRYSVTFNPSF
jgi:di- and tripeptidase